MSPAPAQPSARAGSRSREEIAELYLDSLRFAPYPVQEEALLTYFTNPQGVLVCAPTGTGKTLIAEAALFEALHTNTRAYYTTPLIALTEQKFQELQISADRWGFAPHDIGLITGNRKVNPDARVLVVVAEILLNRLLAHDQFDFSDVHAVVMDEFHSFADAERGIVWELTLAQLPPHVRLLLLSATVGNAGEFVQWMRISHARDVALVEGKERRVPLTYAWVPDKMLGELLTAMTNGERINATTWSLEQGKLNPAEASTALSFPNGPEPYTPALVFCFNRDECWAVAEQLKGLDLAPGDTKPELRRAVDVLDWTTGVGPKLRQMLRSGVGVHHAGLLPKYRRTVEQLFQQKLLGACVCTETLAAGMNLPARSVVLTTLLKGARGQKAVVEASTAHQIFGRAGRPQYDARGFVFALAHEDDVRIARWKEKYDSIPEGTKDPGLLRAKKDLERKKPSRRNTEQYWVEPQFAKLIAAPAGKLYSKGPLPWRLLAHLLKASPDIAPIRTVVRKRLMDEPRIQAGLATLDKMLIALAAAGYVTLEPAPTADGTGPAPERAIATDKLETITHFRTAHPLYGGWLLGQLASADRLERLQALESVLELPTPLLKKVRVPLPPELPEGPLATGTLNAELVARGLVIAPVELDSDEEEEDGYDDAPAERPPVLAEKLQMLFDATHPLVTDVRTQAVWVAGDLLRYGGDFNKYVKAIDLIKQEGLIFRHLLRLILLCGEFAKACTDEAMKAELRELADTFTASCREVDPLSTEESIARAGEST